ncbi:MAG TPA: hypothetical protein VLJ37_09970 [bacterium]|nr:hypothetical protein [bacterium]
MEKKEHATRFDAVETDKRIIDQRLRKHAISPAEYQKILKNAPDDKESAEELVVAKETNQ